MNGLAKILNLGELPPERPLDADRAVAVAHEAARLHYESAELTIGGVTVTVAAKFSPQHERARFLRGPLAIPSAQ